MMYLGELISIGVAFSWTATALLSEFGSKRLGNLTLNVLRMALALVFSLVLFVVVTGSPMPAGASAEAAGWMLLSGLVGYVIGDFCLFQCYIIIGSRYGQLFMTLAPLAAALMAWVTLGQQMTAMSIVAMLVTLFGIGISVLGRGEHHKVWIIMRFLPLCLSGWYPSVRISIVASQASSALPYYCISAMEWNLYVRPCTIKRGFL